MTQQQLAQMAKQLEEMEALDSAMADVMDAKNGMSEDGMNQLGQMINGMGSMDSMSRGMGQGLVEAAAWVIVPRLLTRPRPTPPRSSSRSARARPCSRDSPSPARRSRVRASSTSRARWKPPRASAADALSNQKIPKNVEKHIRAYYDQINKGK